MIRDVALGHTACDSESCSEIVLPIWCKGEIVGALDNDSPLPGRFSQEDEYGLSRIAKLIGDEVDFHGIRR